MSIFAFETPKALREPRNRDEETDKHKIVVEITIDKVTGEWALTKESQEIINIIRGVRK